MTVSQEKRQLIICCDGTNNTLTANDHDTHVLKTFELLAKAEKPSQILYYDPGVGAPDALPSTGLDEWIRNKCARLWGLASGRGIYENISQAYLFLMTHYRPGDQIFLFGFSRGAFTVRCVSGMVHLFGILDSHHESMLPTLLRVYFSAREKTRFFRIANDAAIFIKSLLGIEAPQEINNRDEVATQIRKNFGSGERKEAGIYFVGVWDTVSSVGLPGFSVSMSSNPNILNKRIRHVRHALALDEHRSQFKPRVYEQNDFGDSSSAQSLRQRWFRGNHCDIGGGYAEKTETALSNQSWRWMLDEARRCGLEIGEIPQKEPIPFRVHDESHSMPWWALLSLSQRQTRDLKAIDYADEPSTTLNCHAILPPERMEFPANSIWSQARNKKSLFAAIIGCGLFSLAYGISLQEFITTPSLSIAEIAAFFHDAWRQGIAMSQAQLLAVLHPGCLAEFGSTAHPYIALFIADLGLIASYGFLLARLLSWAFAYRVGFTQLDSKDTFANTAGRLLPLLMAADVLENFMTALALNHENIFLCLMVSLLSATKFLLFAITITACIGLRFSRK